MGLSQLLAVGRSVRTIKDGPAGYKMRQQALLPKFGAEKAEPSRAPETAPSAAEAAPEPARPEPSARPPEASATGAEESPEESDPGPARVAAFVAATRKLRPFSGLARFRNPFGSAPGRERGSAPLQTELVLETVRPVRNDLSDETVEIPAVPRAVPQPETTLAPAPAPALAALAVPRGPLWERVKMRWFGSRHPKRPQRP